MDASQSSAQMTVAEIRERLDRLREHGFIAGWSRLPGGRWDIQYPGAWRTYTTAQAGAWVDGANAMGAAP